MIILGFFRPRILAFSCYANANQIHTTCVSNDKIWRIKNGLPKHKTQFGPLSDLPDYTYLDGRPTPLGSRALNRVKKQEEYAQKMVKLISEIDFAVERHKQIQEENQQKRELVISGRLKEKGQKLLKG